MKLDMEPAKKHMQYSNLPDNHLFTFDNDKKSRVWIKVDEKYAQQYDDHKTLMEVNANMTVIKHSLKRT